MLVITYPADMASRLPGSGTGPSQPHSVESITRMAQDYEYNPRIPLRYWLRSAATLFREVRTSHITSPAGYSGLTLLRQARVYEREGHDEQAYLLLFRHAQLILVNLAKHPEAKDEDNRKALVAAEKDVKKGIEKMEALRPRINKRYENYIKLMHDHHSRRPPRASHDALGQMPSDPAMAGVAKPLEAGEHRDLAVRIARNEISRRATARRATRRAGIPQEEAHNRRGAGVWDGASSFVKDAPPEADNDLSKRIQDVRRNIDHSRTEAFPLQHSKQPASSALSPVSAYKYPNVPRQKSLDVGSIPTVVKSGDGTVRRSEPPNLPPKERLPVSRPFDLGGLPPRPTKELPAPPPALPDKVKPVEEAEMVRTELDPSSYTFKPSAYLENGTPLRSVFISSELRHRFLSLAASNTRRNLETCGILCGTLISNALFVSRLLIPEQTATSDTCETVNESTIFDYCDSEDLIVLGWIHTHPTQTCFMSSRDLHTHCGYQVMLPESIAIVCAPSKTPDWGVFRLTDPPGLKAILNCTQTGLFHPHSESNIYTDALRPGHVYEVSGLEFETVDLRPSV